MAIEHLAVIGAGQMGLGIAQVAAQVGLSVTLADATEELAVRGLSRLEATLARLVEKAKITDGDRRAMLTRVKPARQLEDCAGADFVLEAVVEEEGTKRQVLKRLDAILPPPALLASNTSSISITALASATGRPDRFIGMHFMNPPPLMVLVELVRGLQTSDATHQAALGLTARLGKTAVTCKDMPGFIVNRILIPMVNEACFALAEGLASAEEIDNAAKLGLNHPMGPLALADLIGLDTVLAIAEVLHRNLGEDKYRPAPILRRYVAAGWLGVKSGKGFYLHRGEEKR